MKVILLKDDKKLGKKGAVVNINDGFARNYVLPQKIGVEATSKNLNDLKLHNANEAKLAAQALADAQEFAKAMESQQVVVKMKAGEGGRAFGSVSG
ncbi:MAG: 50S ribosomal protein L9, partial [Lachnospiraceae bacterium]|nr:50S ribosomal protein L9 [Lachnospiraceae bacterium]